MTMTISIYQIKALGSIDIVYFSKEPWSMEEYNIHLPLLAHCAERIDQTVPTWYIFTSPHRNRRQRKVEIQLLHQML